MVWQILAWSGSAPPLEPVFAEGIVQLCCASRSDCEFPVHGDSHGSFDLQPERLCQEGAAELRAIFSIQSHDKDSCVSLPAIGGWPDPMETRRGRGDFLRLQRTESMTDFKGSVV